MKIADILSQIDLGSVALPEFQRGYVWNRDQVRGLMQALYRRYPVGSLLVWVTLTEHATARGEGALSPGYVKLLLDGQQRVISLYGIIRGVPPKFFDGNATAFTGLYFNLEDQTFEFYAPLKMHTNPLWINVTDLMREGVGPLISRLHTKAVFAGNMGEYIARITAVEGIKEIDLHIEEVTGADKTVDVVVEIFNNVNSGGTKLSKGDLALAKVCAEWPQARQEMQATLARWSKANYSFKLDWLLRNINTIVTGEALFTALRDVRPLEVKQGLRQAEAAINYLLNMISGRLGLDHDRVLGGRYAFPVMSHYVVRRGGRLHDVYEQNKLLYWYVQSFLRGRFAGSTETVINQDLRAIEQTDGGLDRLIEQLRVSRGSLEVRAEDFAGWSLGARFYPMLYLLSRVYGARDWETGTPLSANLLGKLSRLEVHHIFPRARLYKHQHSRPEVNALANFCFLTQGANLAISDRDPATYFEEIEIRHPGALASQWIPRDRDLWHVERYRDFLNARQVLLADAANKFLNELLNTPSIAAAVDYSTALPSLGARVTEHETEEEEVLLLLAWLEERGLPWPELNYELADLETGRARAILDAAWPKEIREGYGQPVALLLNEQPATEVWVSEAGYRFFTSSEALRAYVEHEVEHVLADPVLTRIA